MTDPSAPDQVDAGPADPFEVALSDAIDSLPPPFREQLDTVAVVIQDWPTPDQLASVHAFGLYGLYQGVPRSTLNADHAMTPSVITIYKEACMRAARTRDGVRDKVHDTVRHEIAHHFGISDARLRELAAGHRH